MLRPITLSCGHSSCQECLANLVASKPKPACPLCRKEFASDATLNVSIALSNLTNKLGVACTNGGCTWTGTYEEAEDHSNHCPKQNVNCVNEGCRHMLTREELNLHMVACTKQKIPCEQCGMSATRESLPHHLASQCSYKIISCPLDCGETLPRQVVAIAVYLIFYSNESSALGLGCCHQLFVYARI